MFHFQNIYISAEKQSSGSIAFQCYQFSYMGQRPGRQENFDSKPLRMIKDIPGYSTLLEQYSEPHTNTCHDRIWSLTGWMEAT